MFMLEYCILLFSIQRASRSISIPTDLTRDSLSSCAPSRITPALNWAKIPRLIDCSLTKGEMRLLWIRRLSLHHPQHYYPTGGSSRVSLRRPFNSSFRLFFSRRLFVHFLLVSLCLWAIHRHSIASFLSPSTCLKYRDPYLYHQHFLEFSKEHSSVSLHSCFHCISIKNQSIRGYKRKCPQYYLQLCISILPPLLPLKLLLLYSPNSYRGDVLTDAGAWRRVCYCEWWCRHHVYFNNFNSRTGSFISINRRDQICASFFHQSRVSNKCKGTGNIITKTAYYNLFNSAIVTTSNSEYRRRHHSTIHPLFASRCRPKCGERDGWSRSFGSFCKSDE